MLEPDNLTPIRDGATYDTAPHYNRHRLDQRYHPSPDAIAVGTAHLEPYAPLSTITNADLRQTRNVPPPHFSSLYSPTEAFLETQVENQRPQSSELCADPSTTTSDGAAQTALSRAPAAPIDNPPYLTLDKDLIFPPPPSQALYSLKFAISATGTSNVLYQSVPSTQSVDGTHQSPTMRDKALYAISRQWVMIDRFIIQGQRRSTIPGTLDFRKHPNFLGRMSWQCRNEKTQATLIRSKGDQWLDAEGKVIGREEGGVVLGMRQKKAIQKANVQRAQGVNIPWKAPVLELVGVARDCTDGGKMRDLLVVCWVAKTWFTEMETNEHFQLPQSMRTKVKHGRFYN